VKGNFHARFLAACRNSALSHEQHANLPIKAVCAFQKHGYFDRLLARKIHSWIEQRSGEGVRRLENTEPNENATRRFF
jgi:hypothetical protein